MVIEIAIAPPPISVPNVIGLSPTDAGTLLAESVLGYEITEVANPDNSTTSPNTVWHQDPAPGIEVSEGAVVVLQVTPLAPPDTDAENTS